MPLRPEHLEHTRLPNAPLALVVCQVKFPAVFRISDREFVALFQDAIRAEYPNAGEQQEFQILMGPQGTQQMPSSRQWRFADADQNWVVVLSESSIALETRRYSTAEDFINRFGVVLSALETHIKPNVVERVGLRYINEIRVAQVVSASSWVGLIQPHFLGPLGSEGQIGHRIERTVQQMVLGEAPQQINVRHGHFPAGTTIMTPEPSEAPSSSFYLLDFDHYWTGQRAFVRSEILDILDNFHISNYRLFRSAITGQLYAQLEAVE